MIFRAAAWPDGMCGPLCDTPYSSLEPALCFARGRLEYRSSFYLRFTLWGSAAFAGLAAVAGPGLVWKSVLSALALWLTAVAIRAGSWRPLVDSDGWHLRGHLLAWSDLEEILLHRGKPGRAELRTADGRRHSLWAALPTYGPAGWFGSEEAICRLAHQVAHQVGRPPVPVRIGPARGGRLGRLDPHCVRCADL